MSFKQLPADERPRERLSRYGVEGLSAIELIAILLGHGTHTRSVLELASDLLSHFGSMKAISEATFTELMEVKGIGKAKAIQLKAAFALSCRIEAPVRGVLLDSAEKIYQWVRKDLQDQKIEVLVVILRDVKKRIIHSEMVSKGTLTEVLLHPREIFHVAIRHRAHSIVIAHNHPSGDPIPSTQDLEVTALLENAGKMVGIELSDHLIVGKESFISLSRYKKGNH